MACDLVDQCRPLSTEGDHGRKLRRNDIRSHIRGKDIAKLNSLVPALQKRDRGFGFKLKPHFSIEIARVAYPSTSCLDTDVVEDGRDSPEAIIGVHVSNFMRLY